jgi:site-specific DNA-methyltransferase (adenine-specific)
MINKVYLGDCLEIMPSIPDKSIDMILCDLPYGTTACKWDTRIPLEPLWAEYKRVIKARGVVVLFGRQPFTSILVTSNLGWYRDEWIWDKVNGANFGNVKYSPFRTHENVIVFCEGIQKVYNPIMRNVSSRFGKESFINSSVTGRNGGDIGYTFLGRVNR